MRASAFPAYACDHGATSERTGTTRVGGVATTDISSPPFRISALQHSNEHIRGPLLTIRHLPVAELDQPKVPAGRPNSVDREEGAVDSGSDGIDKLRAASRTRVGASLVYEISLLAFGKQILVFADAASALARAAPCSSAYASSGFFLSNGSQGYRRRTGMPGSSLAVARGGSRL